MPPPAAVFRAAWMSESITPAAWALDWRMEVMGGTEGGEVAAKRRKEGTKKERSEGGRGKRKKEGDGFVTVEGREWREAAWEREGER